MSENLISSSKTAIVQDISLQISNPSELEYKLNNSFTAHIESPCNIHMKLTDKFIVFSSLKILYALIKMLETLNPKLFKHHHLKTALISRILNQDIFKGPNAFVWGQKVTRACLLHHLGLFLTMGGDISQQFALQPHKLLVEVWKQNNSVKNSFLIGSSFLRGLTDPALSALHPIIFGCAFSWNDLKQINKRECINSPVLTEYEIMASSIVQLSSRISFFHAINDIVGDLQQRILRDIKHCLQNGIIAPDVAASAHTLFSRRQDIWLDLEYPEKWESEILQAVEQPTSYTADNIYDFFFSLTDIIESRSSFTKDHTVGVTCVVQAFAKAIGASELEAQKLKLAAIMHDIGKIAIPLHILHKQGKLTPQEWKKIKEHVYMPYLFMKDVFPPELHSVLTTASLHHERLDGSGYPWGLKHESIPLGARILQVADMFSALLEHRPYKKPLSFHETVELLQQDMKQNKIWKGITSQAFDWAYESLRNIFPHLH